MLLNTSAVRDTQRPLIGAVGTASVDYEIRGSGAHEEKIPWAITVDLKSAEAAGLRPQVFDWHVESLEPLEQKFAEQVVPSRAVSILFANVLEGGELAEGNERSNVAIDIPLRLAQGGFPASDLMEMVWSRGGGASVSSATWSGKRGGRDLLPWLIAFRMGQAVREASSSAAVGERGLEPLSETLWIYVGELKRSFEDLLGVPVYLYTADDGAFVVDAILPDGRVACIIRKNYAHFMMLKEGEMIDELIEDEESLPELVVQTLRKHLV